jgi:hypothetical protein
MKQSFILWISALLITVIASYYKTVTSSEFPISGTISLSNKKLSYKFDKVHHDKYGPKILIRSDDNKLQGKIVFCKLYNNLIDTIALKNQNGFLVGNLPKFKSNTLVEYKILIMNKDEIISIPKKEKLILQIEGFIPYSLLLVFYLTLLGGLFLGIRTGLEYFNNNQLTKKLSILTLISFGLYGVLISPVVKLFKIGEIEKRILSISEMFSISDLSYFVIWITACIIIYNSKRQKPYSLIAAIVTLLIYLLL